MCKVINQIGNSINQKPNKLTYTHPIANNNNERPNNNQISSTKEQQYRTDNSKKKRESLNLLPTQIIMFPKPTLYNKK